MTIYEQAFKDVQKEKEEKELKIVKEWLSALLTKIEETSKEIESLEEKRRILKKDLEELREGKLEKIRERQEKSPLAKKISPIMIDEMWNDMIRYANRLLYNGITVNNVGGRHPEWSNITSGTFQINCTSSDGSTWSDIRYL